MMQTDPSALDMMVARSDGFLSDARLSRLDMGRRVMCRAIYDDTRYHEDLHEALHIALPDRLTRSVTRRRADFLAGRVMAAAAMSALDLPVSAIAIGEDRAPLWPDGVSGSISHARGRCVCLLARGTTHRHGIDVEAIATGDSLRAIRSQCLSPDDLATLADTPGLSSEAASTLAFSGKEALFKALYPFVNRHFGFDAARVVASPRGNRLTLALTAPLTADLQKDRRFDLSYEVDASHVLTWLSVPAA